MQTRCPQCGRLHSLEISYPAWFKFEHTDGPLDATTLTTVDSEATPVVFCSHCNENFGQCKDLKEFALENVPTPPLEQWVEHNARLLGEDIKTHIECMTDLDEEGREDLWRCIMTSLRQRDEELES